jgi:hypothetical protein
MRVNSRFSSCCIEFSSPSSALQALGTWHCSSGLAAWVELFQRPLSCFYLETHEVSLEKKTGIEEKSLYASCFDVTVKILKQHLWKYLKDLWQALSDKSFPVIGEVYHYRFCELLIKIWFRISESAQLFLKITNSEFDRQETSLPGEPQHGCRNSLKK